MRAVEYRKEGHALDKTAKTFKIGATILKKWIRMYDETGEIKDNPPKHTFKMYPQEGGRTKCGFA